MAGHDDDATGVVGRKSHCSGGRMDGREAVESEEK